MITRAKTTYIDEKILRDNLNEIIKSARKKDKPVIPEVGNIDLWFSKSTQRQLAQIVMTINDLNDVDIKVFFQASFSSVIKKLSFADPRISVPVRLNPRRYEVGSEIYKRIENKIRSPEN